MLRQIGRSLGAQGGPLLPVSLLLLIGSWVAPESRIVKMLLGLFWH